MIKFRTSRIIQPLCFSKMTFFTDLQTLYDYLQLSTQDLSLSTQASENFPLRVPKNFADRIEKGNSNDPLLRQILPIASELELHADFSNDPVGDLQAVKQIGVLHKYHGRVLLISTGACAIHCRYCFRRNFPYNDLQLSKQQETQAIQAIAEDKTIEEVILSGGDPLVLNDARLANLFEKLNAVSTLKRIRIHTRLPIVQPERVTAELLDIFKTCPKKIVLVVHCNHPHEINNEVAQACEKLKNAKVTLLNQSVLLQGVNDDATILCELSEQLFEIGVLPYYLHFLDKAHGTAHFQVSKVKALEIMTTMQNSLSGYLVPKLVFEQAGQLSKQPLCN